MEEEIPLTFRDFHNNYDWPNYSALRRLAFDSDHGRNNLQKAFLKFGKRRLVLPRTLFRLIRGEEA